MKAIRNLEEIRAEIDEIDHQLIPLFRRRMELAADVAEYKRTQNLPTFRPEREQEILEKAAEAAGSEFAEYAVRFFSGIMELSREYQDTLRSKEGTE